MSFVYSVLDFLEDFIGTEMPKSTNINPWLGRNTASCLIFCIHQQLLLRKLPVIWTGLLLLERCYLTYQSLLTVFGILLFTNLKRNAIQNATFFKLEHLTNSGHWLWKHWWKNEQKIFLNSGIKLLAPRPLSRCLKYLAGISYNKSPGITFFFSKVVCHPNFG